MVFPSPPTESTKLTASVQRAQTAWRGLGLKIRSITPAGLIRFLLVLGALASMGWLVQATWFALLPFVIGAVLAYIVLPLVNWLDRFMPRPLAALLAMLAILSLIPLVVVLLAPALGEQLYRVYLSLPSRADLREYGDQLDAYVKTLPQPTQELIDDMWNRATSTVRQNLGLYLQGVVNLSLVSLLSLVNTLGFVIGLLVIPTWLLAVLNDQKKGVQAINRLLPDWLEGDFWAVLRIFDRTLRAFIEGQFVLAVVVGGAMYAGVKLLEFFGWSGLQYQLLLAVSVGLLQLIPVIGPVVAAVLAFLVGLSTSTGAGVALLVLYLLIQYGLVSNFILPYLEQRVVDLHPALLVIIVVALSEFGFLWVLLAAPITAVLCDLFRYIYGRFGEPPRPAGLLPGEPLPVAPAEVTTPGRYIALTYRRSRARRKNMLS